MIELFRAHPSQLTQLWPLCSKLIELGCKDSDWTAELVAAGVARNEYQLWLVCEDNKVIGAGATRIDINAPGVKSLRTICFAGEDMKRFWPLFKTIEDFAKAEGCQRIVIEGRKGWAKLLPDYKMAWITLTKEI